MSAQVQVLAPRAVIRRADKDWWALYSPRGQLCRLYKRLRDARQYFVVMGVGFETQPDISSEGDLANLAAEEDAKGLPKVELDFLGRFAEVYDDFDTRVSVYFNHYDPYRDTEINKPPTVNWSALGEVSTARASAYAAAIRYACELAREGLPAEVIESQRSYMKGAP